MGKDGLRSRDAYGPDGQRPTESMTARRITKGVEHFDDKQPFILSREPYSPPKPRGRKTPDVLRVTMDEVWSEMLTEQLGRCCYYFNVFNETRGSEYQTKLFEGVQGEPCAVCNCPAAVPCKHILRCLMHVLLTVNPKFGEVEKGSEFMVGIRLAPPGVSDF